MRKYFIIALLFLGLFAVSTLSAQEYYPRAAKKDWKAEKKDHKIGKKMFHDREGAASRKQTLLQPALGQVLPILFSLAPELRRNTCRIFCQRNTPAMVCPIAPLPIGWPLQQP